MLQLGATAAKGEPASLAELRRQTRSTNTIMRYRASPGCLSWVKRPHRPDEIKSAMKADSSPQVRVVAAEASAVLGDADADAVDVLAALAAPPQSFPLRLQALASLTALGEKARPAPDVIKQAAEDGRWS